MERSTHWNEEERISFTTTESRYFEILTVSGTPFTRQCVYYIKSSCLFANSCRLKKPFNIFLNLQPGKNFHFHVQKGYVDITFVLGTCHVKGSQWSDGAEINIWSTSLTIRNLMYLVKSLSSELFFEIVVFLEIFDVSFTQDPLKMFTPSTICCSIYGAFSDVCVLRIGYAHLP